MTRAAIAAFRAVFTALPGHSRITAEYTIDTEQARAQAIRIELSSYKGWAILFVQSLESGPLRPRTAQPRRVDRRRLLPSGRSASRHGRAVCLLHSLANINMACVLLTAYMIDWRDATRHGRADGVLMPSGPMQSPQHLAVPGKRPFPLPSLPRLGHGSRDARRRSSPLLAASS